MSHRSNGCGKKGSSKGSSREPAKKSEFFEKFEQIEREFTAIEKECNGVLFCHKSEFRKEHCVLEEIQIKADNDRKSERQNLRQQLGKIRSNVDKFQRELMDVKASPAFVQKLKEMMEDIEESIMHFKDQQREYYDTLLQDERTLIKELAATEKKFESWSPLPPPITTAVGAKKGAVSASLPPAVAAFERFLLQTGGHQGGWDDYDHNMFLKLKAQHKTRDAFLNAAEVSIPGQNLSDLRQHLDWYTEYLSLKESKKLAIHEWKHEKQAEKQDGVNKTETEVEEEEARRQKREELFEKERAERLARLGDYKAQRKLDKAKREEARLKEEMQKAKEKEKAERRRLELKAQVEEYARRRAEEEEMLRLAQQAREEEERINKQPTSDDMARLHQRNMKLVEEKQAKLKFREAEKREKEKRLRKLTSQVEVKAERDPNRLYKLTRGWEERRKDGTSSSGGPVLHMPHRAVPSWRQGLS